MSLNPDSQACEILCIEHNDTCLYAELVQNIESRQLYWVRPIVLLVEPQPLTPNDPLENQESAVYNLQGGADLLFPNQLFRRTLDTELIPLLAQLTEIKQPFDGDRLAHHQLQQFIKHVWQTHPDLFPP